MNKKRRLNQLGHSKILGENNNNKDDKDNKDNKDDKDNEDVAL